MVIDEEKQPPRIIYILKGTLKEVRHVIVTVTFKDILLAINDF